MSRLQVLCWTSTIPRCISYLQGTCDFQLAMAVFAGASHLYGNCPVFTPFAEYLHIFSTWFIENFKSTKATMSDGLFWLTSKIIQLGNMVGMPIKKNSSESIHLSFYPAIHYKYKLSIYPTIHLHLSFHPSIYLSIYLSICLSVCLSIHPIPWQSQWWLGQCISFQLKLVSIFIHIHACSYIFICSYVFRYIHPQF